MTRYQYAIMMVDTDGQDLLISRHTTLEIAEAQLVWLGFGNARIEKWEVEDENL